MEEKISKLEFYTKLLAKLKRLKNRDLELDDYITEVEFKVNHLSKACESKPSIETPTNAPLVTISGSEISFTAHFKDAKKEAPIVKDGMTVKVYFICEEILCKGEYHINEQYYAYEICGSFDCFASISGSYKTWGGKGENKICSHWCYVDELKMVIRNEK